MNFLILTTVYPRGKTEKSGHKVHGKFIRDFARSLHEKGHKVIVLTPHSIDTKSNEKLDSIRVVRFHYFFKSEWEKLTYGDGIPTNIKEFKNKLLVPFFSFAFIVNALKIIYQKRIEILNAHWIVPNGCIAVFIKILSSVKVINTIYGAELFPVLQGKMTFLKPFIRFAILGRHHGGYQSGDG